ncbi:hypothetical protein N9N67_07390 [Bacteriovoracaceae bacterium]|nr:hypothetical protein [Bacteriovoracaceae bacterium]
MKLILMTFTILSFASFQAFALNCEINCSIVESVQIQSKEHECCHKQAKKENKSSNCENKLSSTCLHDLSSSSFDSNSSFQVTLKIILIKQYPFFGFTKKANSISRYRAKIPDEEFLKYRSNLSLYLLKDQFLI